MFYKILSKIIMGFWGFYRFHFSSGTNYLHLHACVRVLHAGTQRSRPGWPVDPPQKQEAAVRGERRAAPELSDKQNKRKGAKLNQKFEIPAF